MTQKELSRRGGKREGAGRKKLYDGPCVSVRIPESMKHTVLTMRDHIKHNIDYTLYPSGALLPSKIETSTKTPVA